MHRLRLIQGVKVQAGNLMMQQVSALLRGVMQADATDCIGITAHALQCLLQSCRNACATRQIRDAPQTAQAGYGQDAGKYGHTDARQFTAVAEIVKVMVIQEELRADVIGSRINLGLEIVHLQKPVGRAGVTFGKCGHTNAKTSRVRVKALLIEALDVANQSGGLREGISRVIVSD